MSFYDRNVTWYLAQLKPNSIKIAERNLHRQGFRTFLPREESTKRTRGRFVTAERPFFPGYVFIGLNPEKGGWRAINSTQGVTRLVSFGREPAVVPPELISDLMVRCDGTGKILTPADLQPGDAVRLTSGPFAGFLTEVEKITPNQRVWVLIDMMGNKTRVGVPTGQVHPVK